MEENESLRNAQLDNLKAKESRQPTFGALSEDLYAELNERVEILMSENALMVDQKTLLSNELEAHQEELALRTREVAELTQILNNNVKDLKACKQHIAQAESDRDEAAEKALSSSEKVGKLEIQIEEFEAKLAEELHKRNRMEQELKETRAALKDSLVRGENDALVAMRRVKSCEDRISELHSSLLQKTEELDNAQDIIRKLRREYQSTRQDAEGMLQVMQGLERQVAGFAEREREVERSALETKTRMEEVLIQRDQVYVLLFNALQAKDTV